MLMTGTQSTDVVIVGAGPYGLAVAAHLRGAGADIRVFGNPMSAWRDHMPKGMFLKSAFEATTISAPEPELSLIDYCRDNGVKDVDPLHPIPLDVFVDYGLHVQKRYVKDLEQIAVTQVSPHAGGFRISLSNGDSFLARKVVSASGHVHFAYTPKELRSAAKGSAGAPLPITHTGEHADFSGFAGRVVAVVGAGQSALESAALLAEAGAEVHLLARGPRLAWGNPPVEDDRLLHGLIKPKTPLGPGWSHLFFCRGPELFSHLPAATRLFLVRRAYGPSGGWWLRPRVEGKINASLETIVEEVSETAGKASLKLRTKSGASRSLTVDHVLVATGYKVDVDAIDYLSPSIRERLARVPGSGAPLLSKSCESTVPGLYFAGLSTAATFGPLLRFVHGTEFAARTIRRVLAPVAGAKRMRAAPAPAE